MYLVPSSVMMRNASAICLAFMYVRVHWTLSVAYLSKTFLYRFGRMKPISGCIHTLSTWTVVPLLDLLIYTIYSLSLGFSRFSRIFEIFMHVEILKNVWITWFPATVRIPTNVPCNFARSQECRGHRIVSWCNNYGFISFVISLFMYLGMSGLAEHGWHKVSFARLDNY